MHFPSLIKQHTTVFAFLFFVFLVAAFYGTTLKNGFVYDDVNQIVENEAVHSLRYVTRIFSQSCTINAYQECEVALYYKPITIFLYMLVWQISQNPFLFHALIILFYTIVVFLVFLLAKFFTRRIVFAFFSALIFAVHPVHTEVANWIAGLPDLTFALFAFLTVLFYYQAMQSQAEESKSIMRDAQQATQSRAHAYTLRITLCALCYFLALFSKESAILLIMIFGIIDWLFFLSLQRIFFRRAVVRYAIFLAMICAYGFLRFFVADALSATSDYPFSFLNRVHAFFTLFAQYIEKLLYPHPLMLFYPFKTSSDFTSFAFLISLGVVCGVAAFFSLALRRGWRMEAFSLAWIGIFLLPVLLLPDRIGESVFAERYLFVPSVGFAFLLGRVFLFFADHYTKHIRYAGYASMACICALSFIVVTERNTAWADNVSLYTATLLQNPDSLTAQRNLAVEYIARREYVPATALLWDILKKNPQWRDIAKVYNSLGETYKNTGKAHEALWAYGQFAKHAADDDYKPANNIASVLLDLHDDLAATPYLCQALALKADAKETNYNMFIIASHVAEMSPAELEGLYHDIRSGRVFKQSPEQPITYIHKECTDSMCSFMFSHSFYDNKTILSLFILGHTPKGTTFRLSNYYVAQDGTITLEVPSIYRDANASFIFPVCENTYYEVTTI